MLDREFGKYRLIRRLGRGGMADVYLATDTEQGTEVALKLVEMGADQDSRDVCEAEKRGARLQEEFCRVDGHVPQVHAWGTLNEYFYIDMEYVEGEDLAERIARGPLLANEAARIAAEVCDFLEKAHQFETTVGDRRIRGIIHGDIKPKNVRLNREGQVKVLDFGIAKGLALSRKLTRNDFGSLSYLSPERLDTGEVDIHVDFWSVGVLLYEMVAGVPPYHADNSPALEALIRSRQPPAALPDTCPPPLARIVLKMLAGSPARRYSDAALIRHDLVAFRQGEPTTADAEWSALQGFAEETRRTPSGILDSMTLSQALAASEGPLAAVPDLPVAAVADSDATRRTSPGAAVEVLAPEEATRRTEVVPPALPDAADPDATRRTVPLGSAAGTAPVATSTTGPVVTKDLPAGGGPAASSASTPVLSRRARHWVTTFLVLIAVGLVINEVSVWSAARRVRVSLATGQSSQMQEIWDNYEALRHRSLFGIGLVGIRSAMKDRLLSQAERVMEDYRQDAPTVREAQWKDAATWLTDVLNLDPGDKAATARLRYCEGQLSRIEGEARKRRRLSAAPSFRDAVAKFEEAGRVDARWPDPYLGLARTYVYGLDDLDKAIGALKNAEQRGYRPGNRELVQLADGYKSRAERWRREANAVQGLQQERECLQKAADDYRQALDLYQKAMGFGEASTNVRTIQSRLDEVEQKLLTLLPDTEAPQPAEPVR